MALRRKRTKNRRYMSDEFTSIFTERKNLLTGVGDTYVEEMVVEQAVEITDSDIIHVDLTQVNYLFLSPAGAVGPGTGDIATPPSVCPSVCPSVTFSFRTVTQKRIAVFSRNFAGTCTK